ncbi:MAG: hypothetical protein V4502_06125 [Pseudomonadota bacterium]
MMTWGFWIVFAVCLCVIAEAGIVLERWWHRRRRGRHALRRLAEAAKPPAIAREAAARRKVGRAR